MNKACFWIICLCLWAAGPAIAADTTTHGGQSMIDRGKDAWAKLTTEQHEVLRCEGTERPFSSELYHEKREGIYVCAGCGYPLFESGTKYDSGTGWPSFYKPIPGHIETKTDNALGMQRIEYHCARCGGHQGHVFPDGPRPTGERYCNNGVALRFIPKEALPAAKAEE